MICFSYSLSGTAVCVFSPVFIQRAKGFCSANCKSTYGSKHPSASTYMQLVQLAAPHKLPLGDGIYLCATVMISNSNNFGPCVSFLCIFNRCPTVLSDSFFHFQFQLHLCFYGSETEALDFYTIVRTKIQFSSDQKFKYTHKPNIEFY